MAVGDLRWGGVQCENGSATSELELELRVITILVSGARVTAVLVPTVKGASDANKGTLDQTP